MLGRSQIQSAPSRPLRARQSVPWTTCDKVIVGGIVVCFFVVLAATAGTYLSCNSTREYYGDNESRLEGLSPSFIQFCQDMWSMNVTTKTTGNN